MTARINYIIATTPDATSNRFRDYYANFALRYHLKILSKILSKDTLINQVTIVKQASKADSLIQKEYYEIDEYIELIKSKNVKVEILEIPKIGISYTQYVYAQKSFSDFEYSLIMEDDWVINLEYEKFDKILVDLYEKNFIDNVGFLDCWSPSTGKYVGTNGGFENHDFHSAISIGLLSKKSLINFVQHLENKKFDLNLLKQLQFSSQLIESGSSIKDIHNCGFNTKILFWETLENVIKDYTETSKELASPLFVPIQFYYKNVDYFNIDTNMRFNKVNLENILDQ